MSEEEVSQKFRSVTIALLTLELPLHKPFQDIKTYFAFPTPGLIK